MLEFFRVPTVGGEFEGVTEAANVQGGVLLRMTWVHVEQHRRGDVTDTPLGASEFLPGLRVCKLMGDTEERALVSEAAAHQAEEIRRVSEGWIHNPLCGRLCPKDESASGYRGYCSISDRPVRPE